MLGCSGLELFCQLYDDYFRVWVLVLIMYVEEQYVVCVFCVGVVGYLMKESVVIELVIVLQKVVIGGMYVSLFMVEKFVYSLGELIEEVVYMCLLDCEMEVYCWLVQGELLIEIVISLCVSVKIISIYKMWLMDKLQFFSEVVFVCYVICYCLFFDDDMFQCILCRI